jgi:hypothetical protein
LAVSPSGWLVALLLLAATLVTNAGTWFDDFSQSTLGQDWSGDTSFFSIRDGALDGLSASPVAPVPLHWLEVGNGWSNYVVQCSVNVVLPNLLICTKGALLLRHNADEGYVFALHVATKTIEVYRLSNGEILLSKDAPLELGTWYQVRAELQGDQMNFFVDDQLIGTVVDDRSPGGATGVAVQDTMETLFDNFTVTGSNIPSNGLAASRAGQQIILTWPNSLTNRVLKATDSLSATNWTILTNQPVIEGDRVSVSLGISAGNRFFALFPVQQ